MTRACRLLGLPRSSYYHHLRGDPGVSLLVIPQAARAYPNRIDDAERDRVVARLNQPDVEALSIRQAHYTLLDKGEYLCSLPSMHRIMRRVGQSGDRRRRKSGATFLPRTKPVVEATAPRQVWCWDITDLPGPGRTRFKLFTMIDMFSRYPVGHRVEYAESKELAAEFIQTSINQEQAQPLVIHADNGSSMRAGTVHDLFTTLGITASHSRPRTSNDNPFIESLFKTVKYDHLYPDQFNTIEQARDWADDFFTRYATSHHHEGLAGHTPQRVHDGSWPGYHDHWVATKAAYAHQHPARHHRAPITHELPDTVWINKPNKQLSKTA